MIRPTRPVLGPIGRGPSCPWPLPPVTAHGAIVGRVTSVDVTPAGDLVVSAELDAPLGAAVGLSDGWSVASPGRPL